MSFEKSIRLAEKAVSILLHFWSTKSKISLGVIPRVTLRPATVTLTLLLLTFFL